MSIVVIGVNHRTTPVELLEKVVITDESMPKALHSLIVRDDIREGLNSGPSKAWNAEEAKREARARQARNRG